MILEQIRFGLEEERYTRTRGDDPVLVLFVIIVSMLYPHTRG